MPAVNPLHDEDDGEDQIKAIRPGLSAKLSEELFSSTQAVGMCTHHLDFACLYLLHIPFCMRMRRCDQPLLL